MTRVFIGRNLFVELSNDGEIKLNDVNGTKIENTISITPEMWRSLMDVVKVKAPHFFGKN